MEANIKTGEKRGTAPGCMPVVFAFLRRYRLPHSTLRLSSTSGKKHKSAAVAPPVMMEPVLPDQSPPCSGTKSDDLPGRGSGSGSMGILARLMGLEELPAVVKQVESPVEKQRKLLEELGKCEEDLKVLKAVINTLQMAAVVRRRTGPVIRRIRPELERRERPLNAKEGPVKIKDIIFSRRVIHEGRPLHDHTKSVVKGMKEAGGRMPVSDGWMECVEDACDEHLLGERREVRRIAVSLECGILADLVVEAVRDMEDGPSRGHFRCSLLMSSTTLKLEACRRRLRF